MNATILVVDDEQQIRKLMSIHLENAGYQCFTAKDVESAKEALASREFDLLVTDLKMPGGSGLELIRYAKSHFPHIGRVMITGFGSPEIASEIMAVGVYGYIIKPLTRNVILITVENALRHLRLDMHMHACKVELEKKVSHRTEKLTAIMNHLDVGVMMVNTNMQILELNRMMQLWFPSFSTGKGTFCYQTLVNDKQEQVCDECPMADTLQSGDTNELLKKTKTSQGNKEFRIVTTPIQDNSGNIYGGIALYDDVTERRVLERDLLQAQKLEAVGQLAAGIAHEINTPIQYVGDNISFLKDSFSAITKVVDAYGRYWRELLECGAVPEEMNRKLKLEIEKADLEYLWDEIPETVSQSQEGIQRVNKIVQAMKDFSHPGIEEKAGGDINRILESTATVCRNEWKYVAELHKDFSNDLKLVPCFSGEISQVFLNIIVNGAHAIDEFTEGGKNGMGILSILTRHVENGVQIRIQDTGGGIPEKIRERVFDPFFTTKKQGKGTGQGLAIAYRVVVEKHQGKLFFETEQGKGTTFVIELPYEPGE